MVRMLLADPDLRGLLARERVAVHGPECQITAAADGEELVRLARARKPHLIVADADRLGAALPATLARLKREPALAKTLVVVTTAKHADTRPYALPEGADAVLTKPVDKPHLYELLRAVDPRLARDIRVTVGADAAYMVGALKLRGRLANVSRGGLFLECDQPSEVGTTVRIELALPGFNDRPWVTGTVVRVDDGAAGKAAERRLGMGVRFVEPPPLVLKTVTAFVLLAKRVVRRGQ